jgi:phosphopantothenoylcysteine decarboxylase/phosphopantothenate--cysteine ligase
MTVDRPFRRGKTRPTWDRDEIEPGDAADVSPTPRAGTSSDVGAAPAERAAADATLAAPREPALTSGSRGAGLRGRTVALCVTGSIAAYKAVEVARRLVKAGAKVLPVMTTSAARFVGPVTLAGVSGEPVATDMWDASFAGEMHVSLAARADLVAIVPATADVLARLAHGRADDLLTALALVARGPVLVAPAMHPRMWEHPATRKNVGELASQGRVSFVGPVRGEVASGEEGMGRMAEPAAIVAAAAALLARLPPGPKEDLAAEDLAAEAPAAEAPAAGPAATRDAGRDFVRRRVVVTAGPTLEDIDPVRFLGNRSTGKMGFAVAERAAARGAEVTLIAGPVTLPTPPGVRRVDVRGALEMRAALWAALGQDLSGADALVMAAAVADHRPARVASEKLKKADLGASIALVKNPDLIAEVGAARAGLPAAGRPVLVAFAVETGAEPALVAYARKKLQEKRVDLVVANAAADSFGREDNLAVLVAAPDDAEHLPRVTKPALADIILDRIGVLL